MLTSLPGWLSSAESLAVYQQWSTWTRGGGHLSFLSSVFWSLYQCRHCMFFFFVVFFSCGSRRCCSSILQDELDLLVPGEQRGDPPPSPQRNDLCGPGRLRAHVAGENSGTLQEQGARHFTASSPLLLRECSESQPQGIISAARGTYVLINHTFIPFFFLTLGLLFLEFSWFSFSWHSIGAAVSHWLDPGAAVHGQGDHVHAHVHLSGHRSLHY